MRKPVLLALSAALIAGVTLPAAIADAQSRDRQEQERRRRAEAEANKKKDKDEWNAPLARLPGERNVGPCPFVKVLYDAARYVEFEGGREASSAVKYAGEIQGVSAGCRYQGDEPIAVVVDVGFSLGKGPSADASEKTFPYWVAVTRRNQQVLAKESFAVAARFKPGQDRVNVNERLEGIVIPRASATTSGSNFEILVGFDVTPEMAAFNRDGKRFRVNATPVQSAQATPPTAAQ